MEEYKVMTTIFGLILMWGAYFLDDLDKQTESIVLYGRRYKLDEMNEFRWLSIIMYTLSIVCLTHTFFT